MRRIAPGVYDDDQGAMHVVLPELLEHNGYEPTPENIELMTRAWQDMAAQLHTTINPNAEDVANAVTHRCRRQTGHDGACRCQCGSRPSDD